MLTKKEILQKLQQQKKRIRSFGVKRLIIFGSYATATAKAGSDIDFIVEFLPGRGLYDDYVQLLQFLRGLFGKEVDLVKSGIIREELKSSIFEGMHIEAQI